MTDHALTLESARALDAADPLRHFADRFHHPTRDGDRLIYLCGNSLGLQPKTVRETIDVELEDWAALAVAGHFEGRNPWYDYHEFCSEAASHIVGARQHEVVMMNALTVNLHLLMVSFYRPTPTRYKILCEAGAFPSDRYAVASQARFHGFDPDDAVVEFAPREGETLIREEDVEAWLEEHGDSVALLMFGGVNYYTGQLFDMERLTKAAHKAGAVAGFDLAHAAGNAPLRLHDWDVDFAVWCSYKYINSGPGGVAGAFVHDRHAQDAELPRFSGWWGNDSKTRFTMPLEFEPQRGAGGWQVSNAPVLSMAAFRASGSLFLEATMPALRKKSEMLTASLLASLDALGGDVIEVISPREPERRGCQLSLRVRKHASDLQAALEAAGVVGDFRPPDVIRMAPTPLYNSFEDVWRFVEVLRAVTAPR
ncbi:MAG: kynureninase [Bradymonadia bacterium]|jgi:kynureninase